MKPGLRKVAALILATATMFGGGALSASTALADDLTVDSSTQVQADTSNSGNADTNSGNTQSGITGSSNADSQTQSDVHADTSIRAQSAPEDAKDVTIHDMLDTDTAYVSKLKLTDRVTGTAPFDNDNERGDDKDASNDIVRSFDDVIYDYDYTVTPDSTMDYYKRTRVGFHFELPYPADKVTFDTDQMGWVDQTPGYQPKLTTETINGVKTQVYTCYRLLEPTSNSPTVNPGTSAIQLAVKVKAAPHGYKFRPTVQAWTAWNKNNPTDTGTHKAMSDTPKDVTVSAKLNLNISLQYQITGGGTYDTTSHTVTVTVTEGTKSHKLVASVAYSNGKANEKSILFQNTYQPEDVLVELSAKKNLTGRELQASEFEFELVDDKGNVIDSEKNDKQGNIQFKPLTYSRDNDGVDDCGEHRYVIREKNTGEKNVTYDKTEHHVTVTVSDNLQGNLTARVEYDPTDDTAKDSSTMLVTPTDKADKTDENAGEDENNPTTTPSMVTTTGTRPEFTNSYIPPATPAIVKAVRQLAQTGVNTPIMAVILFTLVGMGLTVAYSVRKRHAVTPRHGR